MFIPNHRSFNKAVGFLVLLIFSSGHTAWSSLIEWKLNSAQKPVSTGKAFSELSSLLSKSVTELQGADISNQTVFRTGSNNDIAAKAAIEKIGASKKHFETNDADIQQLTSLDWSKGAAKTSTAGAQSRDLQMFTVSNTRTRPNTELDEAVARSTFNEEFVSVPTFQFASMVTGSRALAVVTSANVGVVPVPELSAFFPVIGLVVAVFCTQILRRRRAAQQAVLRRLV